MHCAKRGAEEDVRCTDEESFAVVGKLNELVALLE